MKNVFSPMNIGQPNGLRYQPDFISHDEERQLLA